MVCKYSTLILTVFSCFHLIYAEICSSVIENVQVKQCIRSKKIDDNELTPSTDQINTTDKCYQFINDISSNIKILSIEHGIIAYNLTLPPSDCNYTRFVFKLVASNLSVCADIDLLNSDHSEKPLNGIHIQSNYAREQSVKNVEVSFWDILDSNCRDSMLLTFEYVSSQCYQLVALPFHLQDSQKQLYSEWHYINTKYTPILPHLFTPTFDFKPIQSSNSASVRFILDANLTKRRLSSCVDIMRNVDDSPGTSCTESGSRISQCLLHFGVSSEDNEDGAQLKCTKENEDLTTVSGCIHVLSNELVCQIDNIIAGNYCVVMQLLDERCQGNEASCSWHKIFTISGTSLVISPHVGVFFSSSSTTILLIALILVGCIIIGFIISFISINGTRSLGIHRYRHYILPVTSLPVELLHQENEKQILLVYARDCEYVMNTIHSLKVLLQHMGKCKILDYWDVEHFNNLAKDPISWINQQISNKNMIIIIINSKVAQLLLQNELIHNDDWNESRLTNCTKEIPKIEYKLSSKREASSLVKSTCQVCYKKYENNRPRQSTKKENKCRKHYKSILQSIGNLKRTGDCINNDLANSDEIISCECNNTNNDNLINETPIINDISDTLNEEHNETCTNVNTKNDLKDSYVNTDTKHCYSPNTLDQLDNIPVDINCSNKVCCCCCSLAEHSQLCHSVNVSCDNRNVVNSDAICTNESSNGDINISHVQTNTVLSTDNIHANNKYVQMNTKDDVEKEIFNSAMISDEKKLMILSKVLKTNNSFTNTQTQSDMSYECNGSFNTPLLVGVKKHIDDDGDDQHKGHGTRTTSAKHSKKCTCPYYCDNTSGPFNITNHCCSKIDEQNSSNFKCCGAKHIKDHSCKFSSGPNSKINVKYKYGKCFDDMFVLSLKSISVHCIRRLNDINQRIYTIELNNNMNKTDSSSSYLMTISSTRFIMPQHIESLLYHIHSLSPLTNRFCINTADDDYLKFIHNINLMNQFLTQNPTYLLDLLVNVV